jgi:hypothetical protein
MAEAAAQERDDNDAHPELTDVEQRAMRLGWVPKDQFKGDPDKHRSAEEFLDRGVNMLPLLQRDNEKLHRGMSRLEKRLEEQSRVFEEFQKHSEQALEREYKRGKSEVEARLDRAIQEADVAGAQQARRELADLENDKPKPVERKAEPEKQQADPDIQEWMGENAWFNKDQTLTAYAGEIFGELERTQTGRTRRDLLAETKKKVMERFPEKFGINPRREAASAVGEPSGGTGGTKKKGKTYDDLPADAKKACDKFVRTIPNYTREKYVASYDWDN